MHDTQISEPAHLVQGKSSFFRAYAEVLPGILRSPATWFFVVVYVLAASGYVCEGESLASLSFFVVRFLIYLLFMLLIIPLTAGTEVTRWSGDRPSLSPGQLWGQILLGIFFLLMGILTSIALFFPQVYPFGGSALRSFFADRARHYAWLLISMVVLPVGTMRLLGMSRREMGLWRGYRSWRVLALTGGLPVVILLVSLIFGWQILSSAVSRVWEMVPGVGPLIFHEIPGVSLPEEILYRGILLALLVRLSGIRWGSVLSVLIFALVHIPLTMNHMQLAGPGGLLFAVSVCLVVQGPVGLLLTVLFLRTRSLPVSVVVRTMLDMLPF